MRNKENAEKWRKENAIKNRDRINANMRAWRAKNKEKCKEYSKKRYADGGDRFRKLRRDWYAANPNKAKQYNLKAKYGITLEKYDAMLMAQNDSCAICKKHKSLFTKKLCVDHCHATGKIRKLLCNECNHLLGQSYEDISILKEAINYLKSFKEI